MRNGFLHRLRGFASQQPAADGDQDDRRKRRGAECRDQRRIAILQLDFVGDSDGNERSRAGDYERVGVRAKESFASGAMNRVRRVQTRRIVRQVAQPGIECDAIDMPSSAMYRSRSGIRR